MAGKKAVKKAAKKKAPLHKVNVVNGIKVVYGVEWIEVEWGQRSEGYALFLDENDCIASTKKSSESGPYPSGGGYLGPVRPLEYFEIPFDSLEPEYKKKLKKNGHCHTENRWRPKFKGARKSVS